MNLKHFCNNKECFFVQICKISDGQPKISDSLKISDFSDSLGVLQHPQAPPAIRLWELAYALSIGSKVDDLG